jgi:hypothetical protein
MYKKIGIIGSRRRDDHLTFSQIYVEFNKLYEEGDWIVSGGCPKGGDRIAEVIAKQYSIPILILYANWEKYGRLAGFIRNTDIAKYSDIILASVSNDRTGGTEDTLRKFKKMCENKGFYIEEITTSNIVIASSYDLMMEV